MDKKNAGRYQIRVWGWPTLILYVLFLLLGLGFKLTASTSSAYIVEPESGREVAFLLILGSLFVSYLWVLVFRYSKYSEKKLSKITKTGVIFLTVAFVIGALCSVILYAQKVSENS